MEIACVLPTNFSYLMSYQNSLNDTYPLFSDKDRMYRSTESAQSILPDGYFPRALIESTGAAKSVQIENFLPENTGIQHILKVIANSDIDAYCTKENCLSLEPAFRHLPVVLKNVMYGKARWRDIYAPGINLFLDTFRLIFNEESRFDFPNEYCRVLDAENHIIVEKRMGEWVNDFVRCLRRKLCSKPFQRSLRNWAGDYNRRIKTIIKHINGCFEMCSRLLVVRIDLYQEKFSLQQIESRHDDISKVADGELSEFLKRVERFQNNRRHNKLFKNLISHILKIEYGPDRGYHAHLMLFFNGHKVRNDSYYSVAIGNYWVDQITAGRGSYWACNRAENKSNYHYLGIGLINKADSDKLQCLQRAASYDAKSDLHLTTKACVGQKLLRIGYLPKKAPGAKRGPRSDAQQSGNYLNDNDTFKLLPAQE